MTHMVSLRSVTGPESAARRLPATAWIGGALVFVVLVMALVSLVWTPFDPNHALVNERLEGPSLRHLFGTDRYGRDVLSRIMSGSVVTLVIGVIAVGIGALVGVPLGIAAAFRGGVFEQSVMRVMDVLLAFPALLLAIVTGAVFGASTVSAMVAIGVAMIPGFARVARAGTTGVLSQDYVAAAVMASTPRWMIGVRHVLPNIAAMVTVQVTVSFGIAILAEAGLSFLGLGTPPPDPSWGRMLGDAQASLASHPLLIVFPGLAIALTVLGLNLLGDGIRDAFDPRLKGRS